ncbi:MAG: hypothetical protein ABR524_08075 [Thermoanaerobaculia bacterium]
MRRLPLILLLAMVLSGCGKEPVEPPPPPTAPAPAPPEEITTLLLPILIGEEPVTIAQRAWTTMTIMEWPEPEVLWVGIGGRPIAVKPGASRPPEFRRNDFTGTLLLLPLDAASRLRIDHFLRDQESGATVRLPTPSASEVEEGEAEITLTTGGGAETILRIYDLLPTPDGRVSVSLGRGEHRTLLGEYPLVQAAPGAPHLAEIPLPKQAGDGPVTLTLTPSAASSRLWVLLIELDHLSGDIQVQSSSFATSP